MSENLISGNWILKNKEDNHVVAVCIVEDSPSCYMAANQQMYIKADWQSVQPCSVSLVNTAKLCTVLGLLVDATHIVTSIAPGADLPPMDLDSVKLTLESMISSLQIRGMGQVRQ